MKINVKIVLFEKVQAMIVVLFIAVIIISFFLLFGINYYNLSDFMKIGIFLFIICLLAFETEIQAGLELTERSICCLLSPGIF